MNISCDKAYRANEIMYGLVWGTPTSFYPMFHASGKVLKIKNLRVVFEVQLDNFMSLK